jgi:hypothetical protein
MQRPLMQGTPLQQSPDAVHTCPYSEQGRPASGGGGGVASSGGGGVASSGGGGVASSGGGIEPSGIPASPDGGRPQIPRVEPGGIVHGNPGQQSAVVVQVPPLPTQIPPHTNGGAPPSGVKFGLGTHGRPQQSALVEHFCPTATPASLQGCAFIVQRGIPRMSCWHAKGTWLALPEQQLFSALHDDTANLQMAPAGRQPLPLSQRPTASLGLVLLQLPTPVSFCLPPNPQQSASLRQTSPVGRHPLGGWQMKRPVR